MHGVTNTIEAPTEKTEQNSGTGTESWIVTVFDNSHNTVYEVIQILMIATSCPRDEAELETWEIHNLGKSVVHKADETECSKVAATIAQIGIEVRISQE